MSSQNQANLLAAPPHVLAVDDDALIRQLVADYLGQNGFRVTTVADGAAMRSVLELEVVDLLVLDLKLQAEDGMSLARRLRDESAIPIVMLTGRNEEADRVMGLELGADDYLTKPFSRASCWRGSGRCCAAGAPKCARGGPTASAPTASTAGS